MIAIDDLKSLATIDGPCLSIFQPLRDPFSLVTKTDTRLIAAAQKGEALLMERGMDAADRERFLRPILKLARNTDWSAHSGSIVVFRAPGFTQATFWPDVLEAQVRVAKEFHILPLIAGLGSQRNFWILALSINHIRLLRGTPDGLTEVELPKDLPRSLNESDGFNTGERDVDGRSAPVNEVKIRYLHDFFKAIERAIHPLLARTGRDPLLLAAVPREIALYREVNTYPALLEEEIHGSPDTLGDERLHKTALQLVAAGTSRNTEQSRRVIDAAAGRGLLVTDLAVIYAAAAAGQVERLFIDSRARETGPVDADLLNRAALEVARNSGTIACCDGAAPGTGVAAVLRYRVPDVTEALAVTALTT